MTHPEVRCFRSFKRRSGFFLGMGGLSDSLVHCYRCVYSWRPRSSVVRMCPRCKSRLWNVPKIRPRPNGPTGLGIREVIDPHRTEIRRLCRRFAVSRLRVFGSVARGEASPTSDVDLLVDYSRPSGLLARVELRLALERVLHHRVDLGREETLHWAVRPQAKADAVEL